MPTLQDRQNLPRNLRFLCRFRKSRSQVARELGLNRQQFEKYLSGRSFPTDSTRRHIANYFDVKFESLTDTPATFQNRNDDLSATTTSPDFTLPDTNPDQLTTLRKYIGAFQVHFLTPAWPGKIHIGFVLIREDDRQIKTVFFNRARDPETNNLFRSRLDGRLILRGERLFLIEKTRGMEDRISETILYPSHSHRGKYLTGMSFGVTWRPHRMPFASRTIWRRINSPIDLRAAISKCGIYDPGSSFLDPIVLKFMGQNLDAYTI